MEELGQDVPFSPMLLNLDVDLLAVLIARAQEDGGSEWLASTECK
jgi:hypothetical protein